MRYIYIAFFYILVIVSSAFCIYSPSFYEITRSTCGNATLSDIRTLTREALNDPSNSYGTNRYTDIELNKYINIAYEDLCIQTQCLHSSATGYLTAGTTYYTLPQNCLAVERIIFDGDMLLPVNNPYDLDATQNGWFDAATSSPTAYFQFSGYYTLGFYPCPKYSSGTINMWYIKTPTTLVNDTDEIFDSIPLLNSFRRAIVQGAIYMLLIQEGDTRATTAVQEYNQYIELIKRYYYLQPTYQYKARIIKR